MQSPPKSDAVIKALKAFKAERDEVLLSMNLDSLKKFHAKWNGGATFSSDEVALIALHKARTGALTLPAAERLKSQNWL